MLARQLMVASQKADKTGRLLDGRCRMLMQAHHPGLRSWLEADDRSLLREATKIDNVWAVDSHRSVGPCPAIQASSGRPSSVVEAEMIFDQPGCEWCNPQRHRQHPQRSLIKVQGARFAPAELASPRDPADYSKVKSRARRVVRSWKHRDNYLSSLAEKGRNPAAMLPVSQTLSSKRRRICQGMHAWH